MKVQQPGTGELVKLTGRITHLNARQDAASFVFTRGEQAGMGVIALAAALAGAGGPAMATAANASALEETADYLEFELDGKPVKGWVWRNPFQEGDEVEVAAEDRGTHWELYAIARPGDRTIALYPHCSRGQTSHILNAIYWWIVGTIGALMGGGGGLGLLSMFPDGGFMPLFAMTSLFFYIIGIPVVWIFYRIRGVLVIVLPPFFYLVYLMVSKYLSYAPDDQAEWLVGGCYTLLGLWLFSALGSWYTTHKWMMFVRVAEKVFTALGFEQPSKVDLVKSTKAQMKPDDSVDMGIFFFRY